MSSLATELQPAAPPLATVRHPAPAPLHVVRAERSLGFGPGPVTKILQFMLDAGNPETLAHRAVASLGLLPEIAWAELDGDLPGDLSITLSSGAGDHRLAVGVTRSLDESAMAAVESLLQLLAALHRREVEIEQLTSEARTDPLTGLWNRRGFEMLLDQAMARAHRTGECIAIIACDIDHFKSINDGGGHDVGDQALVAVAHAVRTELRPSDAAARMGGDEIAILLSGCDAQGAYQAAGRLRCRLQQRHASNELPANHLTLSIGISEFGGKREPVDRAELLRLADQALYAAKAAGRDCARVHPRCIASDASPETSVTSTVAD